LGGYIKRPPLTGVAANLARMKVTAIIRPTKTSAVTGEGSDYPAVRAVAKAQVPEGLQVIAYRTER